MVARNNRVSAFAILGRRKRDLVDILQQAFGHRWVASYQVGFGPPLVRSSDRIVARVKETQTALEKLRAYLEVCILDDAERARLAGLHRRLVVRMQGPVEAEAIDAASADVLDLSLRLHIPIRAPDRVMEEMRSAGVDLSLIDADTPPEVMSGRFLVRLNDPQNRRLLHIPDVAARVDDPEDAVAVELRVPVALRTLWAKWLHRFEADTGLATVDLEEPASHARVSRNGERS